ASRRRHTRFSRDWSSDVCSSDLNIHRPVLDHNKVHHNHRYYKTYYTIDERGNSQSRGLKPHCFIQPVNRKGGIYLTNVIPGLARSEERRVGKERSSRRSGER